MPRDNESREGVRSEFLRMGRFRGFFNEDAKLRWFARDMLVETVSMSYLFRSTDFVALNCLARFYLGISRLFVFEAYCHVD